MNDNITTLLQALRLSAIKQQHPLMDVLVQCLFVYNCRCNEILKAEWKNFFPGRFLVLKGSKKSNDVIIRDRELLAQIATLPRTSPIYIFYPLTYQQVYIYCKRNFSHLFVRFKTKSNYKVTHAFRYSNAELVSNEDTLKALLHHNSKKSQKFYKR